MILSPHKNFGVIPGSEQRQYFIISSNGKSWRDTVVPLSQPPEGQGSLDPALGTLCHQGQGTQG